MKRPMLTQLMPFAFCWLLSNSPAYAQIVLEDPVNFEVTNIWSGPTELGVPGNLAGMLFSPDGNLLYIVGESETTRSAVYEVPVVRDPVTNKVIDLLPTTGVIYFGDPLTAGLDAGFEFGPEGTIFNTYWSANKIGQRPGGLTGSETLFDMFPVGIPDSIAGLTFSPHRTDPGTGFGQMLVSSWDGNQLFEVPLTPLGGGLFQPEQSTVFVTLPFLGTGAIQFVPSGLLAGNLMYVNWDVGEVRVLTIDSATGLPIDQGTGQPTQGTVNPIDDLFASGLGVGPWGLEFDPLTNDFFVSTWSGDPVNSVIHISGPGFPRPTIFLLIDDDSIDNGNPPNFFSDVDVNDQIADIGLRAPLPAFSGPNTVGTERTLFTGEVGDEGWFAPKTIPASWDAAGPTLGDGLGNFVDAGPGLGTPDANGDREALLDKILDVTPLRADGLKLLEGETVCAVVYDSDISVNYGPLNGSLKGANLGTVAFRVISVTQLTGFSSSSLPEVKIEILDAEEVCEGALVLFTEAPEPTSSSEPFDVDPDLD